MNAGNNLKYRSCGGFDLIDAEHVYRQKIVAAHGNRAEFAEMRPVADEEN
jgi:hypothetical protein